MPSRTSVGPRRSHDSGGRRRRSAGTVRLSLETLEHRHLLAIVPWTIDANLSSITLSIPDQSISYGGFDFTAQIRNQSGSTSNPWTTNTAHVTGEIVTEYTDGSEITFLSGQHDVTGVPSGNYRPNPAAFDGLAGAYTNTSTAPAEFGARVLAFGLTAAYVSIADLVFDAGSAALPITAGSFPANTTTFGATGGTLALDGVSIILIGQVIPDSLGTLTSPLEGTNMAASGTVASLGGQQRQLTLPLDISVSFEVSPETPPLTGTITGQIVANATLPASSTVVGRQLFYNRSSFDGNDASINASDDLAIAIDKSAYLPGDGLAVFENVSSYSRGINGIMIDLAGGGDHSAISLSTLANDFVFKVGNNNTPGSWAAAPTPSAVSVRTNFDGSGTDRVEITWTDGDITNQWLEVQVLPTSRTGLTSTDVFFWGNKIGDVGNPTATSFSTTAAGDATPIVAGGLGPAGGITNVRDIDRSNVITAAGDRGAATANVGAIVRIDIPSGGPFAPEGGGDAGISTALALVDRHSPGATAATVDAPLASAETSGLAVPAASDASTWLASPADGLDFADAGEASDLEDVLELLADDLARASANLA